MLITGGKVGEIIAQTIKEKLERKREEEKNDEFTKKKSLPRKAILESCRKQHFYGQ